MIQKIFLSISWVLMVAQFAFLFVELSKIKHGIWNWAKHSKFLIAGALVLTMVVALSVKHRFRTLSDETNLLATSQALLFDHMPKNRMAAEQQYAQVVITHSAVPKRPILYAFMTSVYHTIFGYRAHNGIYVNLTLLFMFLVLFGAIGRFMWGNAGALSAMLLILSHPVISMYATSGGFDFTSLFFTAVAVCCAVMHMLYRSDTSFRILVLMLMFLSSTRYESIGLASVIFVSLMVFKQITLKDIKRHWQYLSYMVVLLIPLILQKIASIGSYEQGDGKPLFSLEYFINNMKNFASNFWSFDFYIPFNTVLLIALVFVSLPLFVANIRGHRDDIFKRANIIAFVVAGCSFGIVMFHVAGHINAPTNVRYFLITSCFSVFAWCLLLLRFNVPKSWVLGSSIVFFMIFHPIAIDDLLHTRLNVIREFEVEMEFLKSARINNRNLIINDRPGMFVAHRIPAINFQIANYKGKREYLYKQLKKRGYENIFVFQHVEYAKGIPESQMPNGYNLRELYATQISEKYFLRICRVEPTN